MTRRKNIYLDFAATTPVASEILKAMHPYWRASFGNASSLHALGQESKKALERSRASIAKILLCQPDEILFTSGGTESINLALKGFIESQKAQKHRKHIISTTIEHPAALATLARLKQDGHEVTLVGCDRSGIVNPNDIVAAIKPSTALISVIFVQNEIGTIQPIAEIGKLLINVNRKRKAVGLPEIIFHTDACQTPMFLELNVPRMHVDMLSLDAAKMYGPKGAGLLYVRRGVLLAPQMRGGGQQNDRRSGTEPVPLIVGLASALRFVTAERTRHVSRVTKLRDYLMKRLEDEIPGLIITGDRQQRIANNVHFTLPSIEGETLLFHLDRAGICVSTGSACSGPGGKLSHVLAALKLSPARRAGSLRITLGYETIKADVDAAANKLKKII